MRCVRVVLLVLALGLLPGAGAAAQAPTAPVPCDSIGGGKYACTWYVAGNGRTAGSAVVRDGRVVGYLHQGRNWITCQQQGAAVRNQAGNRNHWYGWTLSDPGPSGSQWGWASALDARGGGDFGAFRGVPDCRGAHGAAPATGGLWPPNSAPPPPPPPPPPSPSPSVNPTWRATYARAFGAPDSRDARYVVDSEARNSDDGIVLVRFFIPVRVAAGGILRGDGRGFTSDPGAASRVWLAWDTETGRLSFTVAHSTTLRGNPDAALPIRSLTREAVWSVRDRPRYDNRVWLGVTPGGNRIDARISVVNSVTNRWRLGAWSIDNDLTVLRGTQGGYTLKINGNGYPATEVYYYPHYGTEAPHTLALRRVQPFYSGKPPDPGGGAAALDRLSWSDCTQRDAHTLFCDSSRGPWGVPRPQSLLNWTTTW